MPRQRAIFTAEHPVRVDLERRFGVRFVRFLSRGGFNEAWEVVRDDAPVLAMWTDRPNSNNMRVTVYSNLVRSRAKCR
jgi:hypothetical protein